MLLLASYTYLYIFLIDSDPSLYIILHTSIPILVLINHITYLGVLHSRWEERQSTACPKGLWKDRLHVVKCEEPSIHQLIGGIPTPRINMKVRLEHHPNYWGK